MSAPDERAHDVPKAIDARTARARAAAAARAIATSRGLDAGGDDGDAAHLTVELRDAAGARVHIVAARRTPGARYFRADARLVVWYRAAASSPAWLLDVAGAIADAWLGPASEGIARELTERPPEPVAPSRFPRPTVLDMVRAGLKPAASLLVGDPSQLDAHALPAVAWSRVALVRDALGNLVVDRTGDVRALRMAYVAREQSVADRARDLDEQLITQRLGETRAEAVQDELARILGLQDELGRVFGYPPCCTRAFAAASRMNFDTADLHMSVARLRWHMTPVPARANHVLAHLYNLPFLIHVPCSATCEPTRAAVGAAIERLYSAEAARTVDDVLGHAAIVFPDDRVVLARPRGAPRGDVLEVEAFNVDPHPEARPSPAPTDRAVPRDAGPCEDAAVTAIRAGWNGIEVFADGAFRPYAPAGVQQGKPLVVVPSATA